MKPTTQRPPQVTAAAWMVIVGSAFVIGLVWNTVANLRSLETRESIEAFLADPPGAGMGLDVEGVITLLHTAAMVAAGSATAAAILGWFVLQRNQQARLGLAIVAVPLFLAGLVTGGFVSSLVAAAAAMLWLSPAREWFRDGTWTPRPAAEAAVRRDATPPPAWPPANQEPPSQEPPDQEPARDQPGQGGPEQDTPAPPDQPWAQQPQQPGPHPGWLAPGSKPTSPYAAAYGQVHAPVPTRRPDAVTVAAVITFVFGGLTALLSVVSVLAVATQADLVLEEMERQAPDLVDQGVTVQMVQATTFVMGGVLTLWAGLAVVLAALLLARRAWARTALMTSAGLAAVLCFVSSFFSPALVVPALACVSVLVLLRRPDVRAWFTAP